MMDSKTIGKKMEADALEVIGVIDGVFFSGWDGRPYSRNDGQATNIDQNCNDPYNKYKPFEEWPLPLPQQARATA